MLSPCRRCTLATREYLRALDRKQLVVQSADAEGNVRHQVLTGDTEAGWAAKDLLERIAPWLTGDARLRTEAQVWKRLVFLRGTRRHKGLERPNTNPAGEKGERSIPRTKRPALRPFAVQGTRLSAADLDVEPEQEQRPQQDGRDRRQHSTNRAERIEVILGNRDNESDHNPSHREERDSKDGHETHIPTRPLGPTEAALRRS